ncbi:transposase [Candidatus Magnetobacterium bavaricum]|uniref:Transposase n=1 Tax=Candidatus Magnetobacterium bavaricum TaxID=29290 RepID=A0A0F3GS94_9BACT|nr:transposase [Candidatus Magnetobacterium bavaricum]
MGTDHDTSEFAVESIRRWWYSMGSEIYPQAKNLLRNRSRISCTIVFKYVMLKEWKAIPSL